ncbi:hypothetical protein CCUS01_10007 [Colletotrichum cuscutae]|uniref:Uncharacterized protein n=1 Tax=Colletotrichum cuscutae TaxID=1209917 RepID=A0AAI9UHF3_9PEZI|nr:hypothetical protein CCUS01_10007 [Colletotrichum cuscutae]
MCEDDPLRKLFEAELRQARRVDRLEMSDIDFDQCWGPILHDWVELSDCRAALLIPREYYLGRKKLPSASAVSRTLHNRKLIFLVSHRPKAEYMWWTFFSSATVASWRLDLCQDAVDRYRPNRGILTAVRYCGSTGPYCEDGILTSFAGSVWAEKTSIYDSLAGFSDAELVPNHAALAILAARTVSTELEVLWEAVDNDSDEG